MPCNAYKSIVPPDIVDSSSSGEVMTREGENAALHCFASGNPHPTITWRREDFRPIATGGKTGIYIHARLRLTYEIWK